MIIFMGLAGSGKSTMGQLLATHLNCPWISTGNLLRQKMDATTQSEMLKGKIISDQQTLEVLQDEFNRIDAANKQFILDGSPRTQFQAEWLMDKVKKGELRIDAVFHLLVPRDIAKKRLLIRHRPDDHEEAIAERFKEYDEQVVPIINYFNSQGIKVHEINSEELPERIELELEKVLGI
jgi:adenylate kinase